MLRLLLFLLLCPGLPVNAQPYVINWDTIQDIPEAIKTEIEQELSAAADRQRADLSIFHTFDLSLLWEGQLKDTPIRVIEITVSDSLGYTMGETLFVPYPHGIAFMAKIEEWHLALFLVYREFGGKLHTEFSMAPHDSLSVGADLGIEVLRVDSNYHCDDVDPAPNSVTHSPWNCSTLEEIHFRFEASGPSFIVLNRE